MWFWLFISIRISLTNHIPLSLSHSLSLSLSLPLSICFLLYWNYSEFHRFLPSCYHTFPCRFNVIFILIWVCNSYKTEYVMYHRKALKFCVITCKNSCIKPRTILTYTDSRFAHDILEDFRSCTPDEFLWLG